MGAGTLHPETWCPKAMSGAFELTEICMETAVQVPTPRHAEKSAIACLRQDGHTYACVFKEHAKVQKA